MVAGPLEDLQDYVTLCGGSRCAVAALGRGGPASPPAQALLIFAL